MRYTLVYGGGEVTLNSTFARRKRNIGGLGGNVMNRQRDSGQWVQTGDGLPTPEIVVLEGVIFSEARDLSLMRAEAAQIATAVSGVTAIKEVSSIGTTTISGFLGGARPSITQEDRYLWKVKLELYIATEIQSFEPLLPPSDLAATGGNNKVDLTWTDAALSGLDKVNIYRGTSSGQLSFLTSVNAGVQAYSDTAVTSGITYFYAVSSVLSSGPESALSLEASATPVAVSSFTFFRLRITANNGRSYVGTHSLEMYEVVSGLNVATATSGAFASSYYSFDFRASRAFDSVTISSWIAEGNPISWPQHVGLEFSTARTIAQYGVGSYDQSSGSANGSPKDWTFEGSNDGMNWTTLDTVTNQTGWGGGELRKFTT